MTMTTSAAGRTALVAREGCRLQAYRDSIGVWTIGVGHTGRAAPPAVTPDLTITAAEAEAILAADLAPFERAVTQSIGRPLTQNQFDACVSLAFNIGAGAFRTSSVVRFASAGRMPEAADAFLLWTRAGGRVLDGLAIRRRAERTQFLAPDRAPEAPPSWLRRTWMAIRSGMSA